MVLHNEVRLIGFCAKKPQLYTAKSGVHVTKLTIYTLSSSKSDRINSTKHYCVFVGKVAERANKLIEKGSFIHLQGSLQYRIFYKNNIEMKLAEILVENFMLSPKEKVSATFRRTLREILNAEDITNENQLSILQ